MSHKPPQVSRSAWENLSLFESFDFVSTWYEKAHKRTASSGKVQDIIAAMQQGREYFRSAADAAPSVRPLLLYYGCLSMARAATLLRSSRATSSSLTPGHGLETCEWQSTLANGASGVLDLAIRCCKGAFPSFAEAIGNRHSTAWRIGGPAGPEGFYYADYPPPAFLTNGSQLQLRHFLERDVRLMSLWEKTTGGHGGVHIGQVTKYGAEISVLVIPFGKTMEREGVRSEFQLPADIKVTSATDPRGIPGWEFRYERGGEGIKTLLPMHARTGGDMMYLMADFPNKDRISELLRTFVQAYVLGMLVRYFPTVWMTLLQGAKGSAAQPLLLATMNHVETDFPQLLVSALNGA